MQEHMIYLIAEAVSQKCPCNPFNVNPYPHLRTYAHFSILSVRLCLNYFFFLPASVRHLFSIHSI